MRNVGIVLFDGAEELDFVGPWQVLGYANQLTERDRLLVVAEAARPIRCAKGMQIVPDVTLAEAPPLDVLLVPGGQGTRREVDNRVLIDWLARAAATATWV